MSLFKDLDKEQRHKSVAMFVQRMVKLNQRAYDPPHTKQHVKEQHEARVDRIKGDFFEMALSAYVNDVEQAQKLLLTKEEIQYQNKLNSIQ